MHAILAIYQRILRIRRRITNTTPTEFSMSYGVNIIFRDTIGMIPPPDNFIFYWFNVSSSFIRVHRCDDPNVLVFKSHHPLFRVNDCHAIIGPSNPLKFRVGSLPINNLNYVEISMSPHTFNIYNQVRHSSNWLHLLLII